MEAAASVKTDLVEALDAVRTVALDRIGRRAVEPVLRRVLRHDQQVPPVDVAAFGSSI